nr:PREDICTED: insulin-like growth factor-binding protein complex acid labile subunit [Bemisia tabaci]
MDGGHALRHIFPMETYKVFIGLIILKGYTNVSICPQECACGLDERGRIMVNCSRGGMMDPIPIRDMSLETEVIHISAPAWNPNSLTIGPIFQQFKRLEELHITDSNIPAIGMHSFWGVQTLQVLDLRRNNLTAMLDHNFRGLANLVELRLDDNRIDSMHSGTFSYLLELKVLSLARNRLSKLAPRLFLMLAKLQQLDLSHNQIQELHPEIFKDVQRLKVFRCRGCEIGRINRQLYSILSELTVLDLGLNHFKYILADEFADLPKLSELYLDGNQLSVILDDTFSEQLHLHTLSLARNRLAKITANAFRHASRIRELDIGHNKLDIVETATLAPIAESLRSLTLDGNNFRLGVLKNIFQVAGKLRHLSLADMGHHEFPVGIFSGLDHLRSLNLSNNNLVNLPSLSLASTPKLVELDLSRNRFQGLDERLMIRLDSLDLIHLSGNPWSCDLCHITPMLHRLNTSKVSSIPICTWPEDLAGRAVSSLTPNMLSWCSNSILSGGRGDGLAGLSLVRETQLGMFVVFAAAAALILAGAVVVFGIVYSKQHTAYYYTNEEKRRAMLEQTKPKKVSIATIDEITNDPELGILANGT